MTAAAGDRSPTRREMLAAGAVAGAAALAAPSLAPAGAAAASADGSSATGDGALLSRVLSMSVLAAYVYQQVFAEGVLTGSERRALEGFVEQERAHVAALRAAVAAAGATVVAPPSSIHVANQHLAHRQISERLGQLRGAGDALGLLIAVERSSIGSCYVALRGLTLSTAIVLVARIMADDAQHEALVTYQRVTLPPHALKFPAALAAAAPSALVSGSH
jgi:hypothetical protein